MHFTTIFTIGISLILLTILSMMVLTFKHEIKYNKNKLEYIQYKKFLEKFIYFELIVGVLLLFLLPVVIFGENWNLNISNLQIGLVFGASVLFIINLALKIPFKKKLSN